MKRLLVTVKGVVHIWCKCGDALVRLELVATGVGYRVFYRRVVINDGDNEGLKQLLARVGGCSRLVWVRQRGGDAVMC